MPYIGYAFILLVCLGVTLVVFGKIHQRWYPHLLFGIGAGIVLMTSLAGPYLVGSDIHLEYYYAKLRAGRDVLQPIVGIPQGTSILSYVTDNIWAYKLVYPLLFALVPVLLYYIYRTWLTSLQSFLASFFFITFPAFFMELPGIPRQMVAEILLAVLMLSLLSRKTRLYLIIPVAILIPLVHYAIAVTAIVLVGPWLLFRRKKLVGIALGVVLLTSLAWFPVSEGGAVAKKLAHIYNSFVPTATRIDTPGITKPLFTRPEMVEHPPEVVPPKGLPTLSRYEELLLMGVGVDFFKVNNYSKTFRVLQWVVIGLILLGLFRGRHLWRFILGGLVLVVLLVVPGFSNLLNSTRFIHISLLVLSPLLAISCRPKLLLVVLVPYFLFTSGAVFELSKQTSIEKLEIPYNVGFSSYRIDLGASVTEDDIAVRQYIYDNKLFPIFSDIVGADLFGEVVGWRDDLHVALRREPVKLSRAYVFVRSRNVKDGTFTAWNGIGRRKYVDPKEYYGIEWNKDVIYQKGDSRVIWVP